MIHELGKMYYPAKIM